MKTLRTRSSTSAGVFLRAGPQSRAVCSLCILSPLKTPRLSSQNRLANPPSSSSTPLPTNTPFLRPLTSVPGTHREPLPSHRIPRFTIEYSALDKPFIGKAKVKASKFIPKPTSSIPDHETFLNRIGRDCAQFSSKFNSWDAFWTASSAQMEEMGIPPKSRKYILSWKDNFRSGIALRPIPLNKKKGSARANILPKLPRPERLAEHRLTISRARKLRRARRVAFRKARQERKVREIKSGGRKRELPKVKGLERLVIVRG
ncbi:hypothetical protein M427DRAFT_130808 [Gonapodya prolifera JEL478]|uniref:Small ribosomal subunit protein mS41 n=1 Tax=Gonapodya prolifera (strain JEL478) TaxID=1344416 RepID=A0A139AXX0_GONPJ|nr:hypothetical protein M427DRAFT_130808 [Gonapodya prolifera JEL478]|eukprot:KXS21295.1 hypothetical protein M427DRAFT_130808 [Gonapodya prolifera JEL478]